MSDDPRLGSLISEGTVGDVVLLGMPWDEGVRRNGGRVGACNGPSGFRRFLPKMGALQPVAYNVDLTTLKVVDGGDCSTDCTLEEAHEMQVQRVHDVIANGGVAFVVGGGNDQSYPNASGLLQAHAEGGIGVVNIDAHLDVRPLKDGKVHSGSPFRLLLEDERFQGRGRFVEFAAQSSQCSKVHADYVLEGGHDIMWWRDLRRRQHSGADSRTVGEQFRDDVLHGSFQHCDHIFVSFDIDVIKGADAPGVSCVASVGLTAEDAIDISYFAGCDPRVRLFDVSEYNPAVEEWRTGRLVVNMFYHFLIGVASRAVE